MTSPFRIANLLLFMCLSSCNLGPDYKKPEIDLPDTQNSIKSLTFKNDRWWEIFSIPELNSFEIDALTNNFDISIAAANIKIACATLGLTDSNLLPSVGLNAQMAHDKTSKKGKYFWGAAAMPTKTKNFIVGLGISYEIDFWGKYRRLHEAAQAELNSSKMSHDIVVLTVSSEVAKIYFAILGTVEKLKIYQRIFHITQNIATLIQKRYQCGYASKIELLNINEQLEKTKEMIYLCEQSLNKIETTFKVLLGHSPKKLIAHNKIKSYSLSNLAHKIKIPSGLPSNLLQRRPDICEIENKLIAANAKIGAARAEFFPSFSLTGNYGYENQHLSGLFSPTGDTWNYVTGIFLPIFTGNKIAAEEKLARARYEHTLAVYQKTIQVAFKETLDSLVNYKENCKILLAKTQQFQIEKEKYNLISKQLKAGLISKIDILEQEKTLLMNQLDLITAEQNKLTAVIDVCKSIGGGWNTKKIN